MRAFTTAANGWALVELSLVRICHFTNRQPASTQPSDARVRLGSEYQIKSCFSHIFRPDVSAGIAVIAHIPHGEAHVNHRLRAKGLRKLNGPRHLARVGTCPHFSTLLKV